MAVRSVARRCALLGATVLLAVPAAAQEPAAVPALWPGYAADDELENYLRSLQALGLVATTPWSIRQLSPVELRRLAPPDSGHPWATRVTADTTRGPRFTVLRPHVGARYNSAFPVGSNDGAVWAGRGVTGMASIGAALAWGPLSLVVQPVAFWTQNQAFELTNNGLSGAEQFGDGLFPRVVDRPQRFGDARYARLDPGQSTLRLDVANVALGASTANAWWGPAQEFPFLLGTNAAGFPHVFVGTSRPADIWIARVHGRLLYGRLEQSDYFVLRQAVSRARRFATGVAVAVTPRGMDYLEIGAARFFHAPWPDDGIPSRYLTRPFEDLLKQSIEASDESIPTDPQSIDGENQLAAAFLRFVLPGTGFEAYGEVGREDHSWDVRHFILSPDENSSLMLGFRQTLRRGSGSGLTVVRGEVMSFGHGQADRVKGGRAIYIHGSGSDQGHTHRGQLLGADVAVGSGGAHVLGVDMLSSGGRTTVEWRRVVRQELPSAVSGAAPGGPARDVLHTLSVERALFRGDTDLIIGADVSYNLNRDFVRDRTNLGVRFAATGAPW